MAVLFESGILLVFLCFLCVRSDYVRHVWAFILALCFWGGMRVLMEFSFRAADQGGAYAWGSVTSVVAAACLLLCIFFLFIACLGARRARSARGPEGGEASRRRLSPSERIRQLIPGDDRGRLLTISPSRAESQPPPAPSPDNDETGE